MKTLDVQVRPRPRLRIYLQLARARSSLTAALYCFLGAYLGAGFGGMLSVRVTTAAAVVALAAAFGFTMNDICDAEADRLGRPSRPIPAGRISMDAARRYALVLALGTLLSAYWLGAGLMAFAACTLAAGALYALRLKGTLLLGNALIALLDASVLLYGSLAAGAVTAETWMGCMLAFVYVLAQEVLFAAKDEKTDRMAGIRTTAVRLGERTTLRLFAVLAFVYTAAAFLPVALGFASRLYLVAVVLLTAAPLLWIAAYLALRPGHGAVQMADRCIKYLWVSGIIPILLLR